jgi:hypothetical protein
MHRPPGVTFNSCTTGSTVLGHLRNLIIHRVIVEDTVIDRCKGCVVSAVVVVVQLHDQVVVIVGRWIRSVICSRRWRKQIVTGGTGAQTIRRTWSALPASSKGGRPCNGMTTLHAFPLVVVALVNAHSGQDSKELARGIAGIIVTARAGIVPVAVAHGAIGRIG